MSWINKISSLFKDLAIILMIFLFIFILGHYLIQGAVIAKRVTLGLPIDDLLILDYNFGEFDEAVDKKKFILGIIGEGLRLRMKKLV